MVAVAVGDDGPLDPLPGVNGKAASLAGESFWSLSDDAARFHAFLLRFGFLSLFDPEPDVTETLTHSVLIALRPCPGHRIPAWPLRPRMPI
jgi:hypothetical protein